MTSRGSLRTRSTLSILLISTLSLSACATKPDRRAPPSDRPARTSGTFLYPIAALLTEMDRNADKVVSRAEMIDGSEAEWTQFAVNPSAIDFSRWSVRNLGSTDAQPGFMSFDRDFNGVISKAEFMGQMETEFIRLDVNRDARLDRSEMVIAFQAPQGASRAQGRNTGDGQGRPSGGRPTR